MVFKILKSIVSKLVYTDGLACAVCGKEIDPTDSDGFCSDCVPKPIGHCCNICGQQLKVSQQSFCDECLYIKSECYFDEARAPYSYIDDSVRKIVYGIKYGGKSYLAKIMAKKMYETLCLQNWNPDYITYVPLHKRRERQRGYNQSRLIAEALSELANLPLINALAKIKYSRHNAAKLGKESRKLFIADSFATIDTKIIGKNILLIDDVCTSKATANECAKTLKQSKASKVWVLTFATARADSAFLIP